MNRDQLTTIVAKMNNVEIGPPPWSDEVLTRAYFRNFMKTRELIQAHPGSKSHKDLEDLARGLELLHDAIDALKKACHSFRADAAVIQAFSGRANQGEFDRRGRDIRLSLFAAVCAAQSLVDTCNANKPHLTLADYKERVRSSFSTWPVSRFIHGLRRYLSHRRALEAHWQVRMPSEGPQEIRFLLRPDELLAYDEWPPEAMDYISQDPKGVDPEKLFDEYRIRVDAFHAWLHVAFSQAAEPELSEYRRHLALLDRLGSRSNWNMLVDIGIKQHLDPYTRLPEHLTPEELKEISDFPHRSVEQVNRIIQMIDVHGACDEALRKKVYLLFQVDENNSLQREFC